MTIRRSIGLLACLLAAGSARPWAQQPPAGQQASPDAPQTTFRSRIDSVMVDVQVDDKQGKPITDLTRDDFEIKENNKLQTIDTFKFVQLDDSPIDADSLPPILSIDDERREVARDDNRLILIFLDDYHVMRANSQRIRIDLAKFVNQLNPRDLVAVMYPLMPVTAISFSRDHEAVAREVMAFEGRKYDYTPKNDIDSRLAQDPPEIIEQERNAITISALQTLCAYLGTLREGRKTVLLTSEGLTGSTPSSVIGGTGGASAASAGGANLMTQFEDIFADAARTNTSLYTLDPRGLAVSEFGSTRNTTLQNDQRVLNEAIDSLRVLSDNTGGRAIVGTNDPMPGLKQMVRDSSAYYLLSYTSTEKARDGRFHPIRVTVLRKDVKESDVRARKGYWAYSADEVTKMTAPPKEGPPRDVAAALDTLGDTRRGRAVRFWTGAATGAGGKAAVTLVWEAVPPAPGDSQGVVDHVTVTATSLTGDTLFSGAVPVDASAASPAGQVTFAAPPGTVSVKTVAETAKGLRIDSEDLDVDVPDFTAVGVYITTPLIFRARTAHDIRMIRTAAAPPVPAVTREFMRSEQLLIRFQAYGPGGTTPTVTARLLNQLGDSVADLPPPTPGAGGTFEIDLPLGTLAEADYLVEITAASGSTQKKTLLPIRVTN